MRSLIAILLLLSLPASAEPMTLTMAQAREVYGAILSLDGYQKIIRAGDQETAVRVPYSFSSGTLLALAKNTDRLKPVVTAFDTARTRLILDLSAGTGKLEDPEAQAKFLKELNEMLKAPQDVDLVKIRDAELGLGAPKNNPIPPSVISQLAPIRVPD